LKILVIGSEGNIGRKLVPYLREHGHEVLRADIVQQYAPDYVKCDINILDDLIEPALKFKPEAIYHMAGMVSRITCEFAPYLCVNTNISGTNNIIQLCKMLDAKMINFSTSEVYGNVGGVLKEDRKDLSPNNRYGLSKLLAEKLVEYEVKYCNLKAVTTRLFMIYDEDEIFGEHRSAMIRFAEALCKGEKITVHKDSVRSWMHIEDCVEVLHRLLFLDDNYHVINIGHPAPIKMEDLARIMATNFKHYYTTDFMNLVDLPKQMTLTKIPSLLRQTQLLKFKSKVSLEEGIKRVVEKVKERLK